jgi:site-specific DNA-methyltransferase (adenine-specific)
MKHIGDQSVDMILCDPPYGTTSQCEWDKPLPGDKLWTEFRRMIKDNGAIIIMAAQPFATDVINDARDIFRYDLIWVKTHGAGFLNANRMPLRKHELILVFYKKLPAYNPQFGLRSGYNRPPPNKNNRVYGDVTNPANIINKKTVHPSSVIVFANGDGQNMLHPTQKPIGLFEYLIKTYSNPGELVLDPCMGSGTTAEACMKSQRQYIGFEVDVNYYNIIKNRIHANCMKLDSFEDKKLVVEG